MEYENAQKRILEVFGQWKAPGNFKIDFFVIRVGEWGGHMLMECDDLVGVARRPNGTLGRSPKARGRYRATAGLFAHLRGA